MSIQIQQLQEEWPRRLPLASQSSAEVLAGSGQRAPRENGLEEAFARKYRPEADAYRAYDLEGNLLFAKDADEDNLDPKDVRPEIDRSVLRRILLDAIPADTVKWGHALASVRDLSDGERELTFANGDTAAVDILVGADGAKSHVRPLISPAVPIYHGVTGAESSIAPEDTKKPELQDIISMVGDGSMGVLGGQRMLASQRNGDGRIPHVPLGASLRKLIKHCDDNAIYTRPLYHMPLDHKWKHVPGVTILGDAAHVMSPFGGAGTNLAMLDALELGIILADAIDSGTIVEGREAAVAAWEEKRTDAANLVAGIVEPTVPATIRPDARPEVIYQGMLEYMVRPELRRKACRDWIALKGKWL
ncbi:hypothetical protein BD309DRAFT_1029762 [Dichomitus squalens]|nr:hypothetical protein BD309DRAFT_1029762 [Dichomitus squalens]